MVLFPEQQYYLRHPSCSGNGSDVRGTGLILGAELASDAHGRDIVNVCLEKGIIINCTVGKVLRFLPPLIITEDNINDVLNAVELVLTEKGL